MQIGGKNSVRLMNLQFYTNLGLISLCAQFAVKNGPVSVKTIKKYNCPERYLSHPY